MAHLVPTCVWRATPDLLLALDAQFGEPVDTYVNGSQVWLRDDGPAGEEPPAALDRLWEGLEAFAAYDDELEPATLAAACTAALGVPPDAVGVADHDLIGDQWEQSGGATSIVRALLDQLG